MPSKPRVREALKMETITEEKAVGPSMSAPDFDALLKEAAAEFQNKNRPKYTMPQVLGEYRAVEEKPGLYARPMCLEVELRALELYEIVGNGTVSGLARIGVGIASAVLYRAVLPMDEAEARQTITAYVRGQVKEEEIFQPISETEVGRMFRDTDELRRLVLDPLNLTILGNSGEDKEADPNA